MEEDDALEFSRSISQIGEGWFRQVALGVKLHIPETLGLSRHDWCDQFKVAMRSPDERRLATSELKADGLKNVEIADVLGVSHSTIGEDERRNRQDAEALKRPELTAAEKRELKAEEEKLADERILKEAQRASREIDSDFEAHVNSILDGLRLGANTLMTKTKYDRILKNIKRLEGTWS